MDRLIRRGHPIYTGACRTCFGSCAPAQEPGETMAGMSHRERVMRALSHQEPDRVPVDLGATRSSSLVVEAYENLNRFLGAEAPTRIFSKWLNIAHPSEAMLARFDIDTRSVSQGSPETWQDIVFPDG